MDGCIVQRFRVVTPVVSLFSFCGLDFFSEFYQLLNQQSQSKQACSAALYCVCVCVGLVLPRQDQMSPVHRPDQLSGSQNPYQFNESEYELNWSHLN